MGPGFMGPPPFGGDKVGAGVERPHSLREVPRFLTKIITGFFSRLFYIFKLVWETNPAILFLMSFVALFEGVMPVVGELIKGNILNELQKNLGIGGDLASFLVSQIFFLLIFFFSYRILNAIVSRVSNAVTRIAGEKVVKHVRLKIMHKAQTLDPAAYDSPAFYEKLENANREAGNRPIQILSATFSMVSAMIGLGSYIAILLRAPDMWWASIVIVLMAIPSAIINFTYRRRNFQYIRRKSKERRQMNYYADLMVNKDMVKEVRMYDLSDTFIERYNDAFTRYYLGLRKMILSESFWHIVTAVVSAVVNCVFFAMIAFKVYRGELMIGDYSVLTGALLSIAGNVTSLIGVSATIYEGTLFIDNLLAFLNERQTLLPRIASPLKVAHGVQHTIVFEHVSFRYPGTERDVLRDVNLTLRPGESLVLVGLNGAGKTTLLKLLTRLYDPTDGCILLDGQDLRDYDVKDLYRMFGIIFQDFGRYAETVKENIHFGSIHKEMDDGEIREAAVASGAAGYIEKLPGGYETPLMRIFEPDGLELSGGQWQKVAIARAFYSDSDVLILDEPTASLDAMAEQEIYNQFDRLREGKTTIFVSHRLSSATTASKIVVLEYGAVIEEGTHRELMAAHGRYYELFSTQAKRYREEPEEGEKPMPGPHRPHFPGPDHSGMTDENILM